MRPLVNQRQKALSESDKEVMHMWADLFMVKSRLDKLRGGAHA